MVKCPKCLESKPEGDYSRGQNLNGLASWCKDCSRASARASSKRNMLHRYGLTEETYQEMLDAQGGGCAVCGSINGGAGRRLAVDHDHACCPGKESCGSCIRGLLCFSCNTAIGHFQESADLMEKAVTYLRGAT